MSCLPNLLQRWICRDFLALYFRKLILKPSWDVLPYPGRALGPQASHTIAFVFCFCTRAEGTPFLLFSIWRLQTRAEEEGGRGRKAGKEMDSCGLTRYSPASPHPTSPSSRCSPSSRLRQPCRRTWCEDRGRVQWEDQVWSLTPPLTSSAMLYASSRSPSPHVPTFEMATPSRFPPSLP